MAAERGRRGESTGQRIAGKYELRRLLGIGAMGAVYEGVHLDLRKRLAIKLIHPEFCESAEVLGRFRREARAASAIDSEHITQIFDFGRDAALGLYMVFEFLVGEDLEARLGRDRWIDAVETAAIGWQLSRGLARAHGVGVVHRDLKPGNVFLTTGDDGSPLAKILDFGISKLDSAKWAGGGGDGEAALTERGTTVGTPQYMSPEQCLARGELDGRTDVWSLCAVLYEMLAGEPLVPDGAWVTVMQRIVSQDVCPLALRAPWVPAALARVIDDGLVRDRDRRIDGASTLADRLLEVIDDRAGGETSAMGDSVEPTGPSPIPSDPPPPSSEDRVEMFMRSGEVPVPLGRRGG